MIPPDFINIYQKRVYNNKQNNPVKGVSILTMERDIDGCWAGCHPCSSCEPPTYNAPHYKYCINNKSPYDQTGPIRMSCQKAKYCCIREAAYCLVEQHDVSCSQSDLCDPKCQQGGSGGLEKCNSSCGIGGETVCCCAKPQCKEKSNKEKTKVRKKSGEKHGKKCPKNANATCIYLRPRKNEKYKNMQEMLNTNTNNTKCECCSKSDVIVIEECPNKVNDLKLFIENLISKNEANICEYRIETNWVQQRNNEFSRNEIKSVGPFRVHSSISLKYKNYYFYHSLAWLCSNVKYEKLNIDFLPNDNIITTLFPCKKVTSCTMAINQNRSICPYYHSEKVETDKNVKEFLMIVKKFEEYTRGNETDYINFNKRNKRKFNKSFNDVGKKKFIVKNNWSTCNEILKCFNGKNKRKSVYKRKHLIAIMVFVIFLPYMFIFVNIIIN